MCVCLPRMIPNNRNFSPWRSSILHRCWWSHAIGISSKRISPHCREHHLSSARRPVSGMVRYPDWCSSTISFGLPLGSTLDGNADSASTNGLSSIVAPLTANSVRMILVKTVHPLHTSPLRLETLRRCNQCWWTHRCGQWDRQYRLAIHRCTEC